MTVFPQEERLLGLLGEAAEFASQVIALEREQSKYLIADDLDAFNKSLDSVGGIIERMKGLHQETEPLMQSYASYYNSEGGSRIEAIDNAAQELVSLMEQCSAQSNSNLEDAKDKANEFVRQIDDLSTKRKSVGIYAQSTGESSSSVFDKKT